MLGHGEESSDVPLVSASILSADFGALREEAVRLAQAGADSIHVDVMDGHFVPNLAFGPDIVRALHAHPGIPLQVHLMLERPRSFISSFAECGADMLIFHYECDDDIKQLAKSAEDAGCSAGLAINPETGFESIRNIVGSFDLLQIMGVHPGLSGQAFIPDTLKKIGDARAYMDMEHLGTVVAVDGGVKLENSQMILNAGADQLVVGSYLSSAEDVKAAIDRLKGIIG